MAQGASRREMLVYGRERNEIAHVFPIALFLFSRVATEKKDTARAA
jgi:hypothetical protein